MTDNVTPFSPRRDPPAGRENTDQAASTEPAALGRMVYTVKETAQQLSLSLGTTYQLIRSGQIPAMKLGGRWVVPKRRLHEWVNSLPEAKPEDLERDFTREFGPNWRNETA
jgi:excisionase family DNA binding protein